MANSPTFTDIIQKKNRGQKVSSILDTKMFVAVLFAMSMLWATGSNADCSLPEAWTGQWFITEFANGPEIIINSSTNSIHRHTYSGNDDGLDKCVWRDGDFFVFKNAKSNCNRCVLLSEKHENVLFSRESSECLRDNEWDSDNLKATICSQIGLDDNENRYFWFRTDFKSINCPLGNSSFQFGYLARDGKRCETPISHSSACFDSTKFEFQYEACPDNQNSVAKSEKLTCVAAWEESGYGYFVADLENTDHPRDRFRCFVYHTRLRPNPVLGKAPLVTGYDIGTLDSATCNGLHQPDPDGSETVLYLRKDNPLDTEEKPCNFPGWLVSHKWVDMGKSIELDLLHSELKNTSIHVRPGKRDHNAPNSDIMESKSIPTPTPFPLAQSTLLCLQKSNISGSEQWSNSQVAVVAKYTAGCKIDEVCLHLIQRSEDIVQIYYMQKLEMERDEFRKFCFNSSHTNLQRARTLITTRGLRKKFKYPGIYIKPSLVSHVQTDSLNSIVDLSFVEYSTIGCEHENYEHPPSERLTNSQNNHEYLIMDGWTEENSTFTVISSKTKENRPLYCVLEETTDTRPNHSIFMTSQDCVHVSKMEATPDAEKVSNLSESLTDSTFSRIAYCNFTAVGRHEDFSDKTPLIGEPGSTSTSTDGFNSGLTSADSRLKAKPVFVMTTILIVFTLMMIN